MKRQTVTRRRAKPSNDSAQPLTNTGRFKHDHRKTNPGLHRLYVEWAVRHLAVYEQAMRAFGNESNLNMLDGLYVLGAERAKLIRENAAYAEADKLINTYNSVGPLLSAREVDYNRELDKD